MRTLSDLARIAGGRVVGDGAVEIRGVNGIDDAGPGEITFVAHAKYAARLAKTKASAAVVADGVSAPIPLIVVADPNAAFTAICGAFADASPRRRGVHATAVVGKDVRLGRDVGIGPHCVVEDGASIGDRTVLEALVYVGRKASIGADCTLHAQAVVREECALGDRVILQPGAIVGSDGYGYVTVQGVHHKIPQTGIVVLEDDVELGACTTVDRARFGKTVVKKGTKIDNLVQVAHNVTIGEHCLFAANTSIAGSTKFGHHVIVGGHSAITGHIEIGDGAIVTGQTGVAKSVPPGAMVSGPRARPTRHYLRELAEMDRLSKTVGDLKKRLAELEKRLKK